MGRIISYISILILTFIFAYVFPVDESYILFYMVVLIPIFDIITFIYFKRNISIEVNVSDNEIEKNDNVIYRITIKNKGIIPIPFVDYEIENSGNLERDEPNFKRISIGPRSIMKELLIFKGIHVGEGFLNLERIQLLSIFGLFRSPIEFQGNSKIIIKPRTENIDGMEKFIENTFSIEDDDSCSDYNYLGEAGYEYREYIPGDPLNRVNWKLSSKENNKLIIRKSVSVLRCNKTIIIDPLVEKDDRYYYNLDLLLEGTISLVNEFILGEYEVSVLYRDNGRWTENLIKDNVHIENLQRRLSKINILDVNIKNRFNGVANYIESKNNIIIVTTNNDKEINNLVNEIINVNDSISIISNVKDNIVENQYYLSNDYRLVRV
ncbi:MAG: DUF58 domain-containing protein [Clostridiales bacterium]|nr:DUF58 domain-containing protein [Clostridiales bacterium]